MRAKQRAQAKGAFSRCVAQRAAKGGGRQKKEEEFLDAYSIRSKQTTLHIIHNCIYERYCVEDLVRVFVGRAEDPDEETKLMLYSIINRSFFLTSRSSTSFPFCKEMVDFGFPSSHFKSIGFVWDLWNKLINTAVEKGQPHQDVLGQFLLIWAGCDGIIFKDRFEVLVVDNEDILCLFRGIF